MSSKLGNLIIEKNRSNQEKSYVSRRQFLKFALSTIVYTAIPTVSCSTKLPAWIAYPGEEWETISAKDAGISNVDEWHRWIEKVKTRAHGASFQGEDHSGNRWGLVITRGGYLIASVGDPDYKYQTSSLGKCFTMACLQLAVEEGLIKSANDVIKDYWTGEGQLNQPHKYLNQGYHRFLTFNHLKNHQGGFPVTNGWSWKSGANYNKPAPKWAKFTGDPDFDNYSHAKPSFFRRHYSSGGYWRLAQALTAVWNRDLKNVLDEKIFSHLGISADRWDMPPGEAVRHTVDFYPKMPGYGQFLDPPYEINGNIVRGGQWVEMSAKDLARFGLLVATGGYWKGKRLIKTIRGHNGGNGSNVGGIGGEIIGSWGKVTCSYNHEKIPWKLFSKPPIKRTSLF